MNSTNGSLTLEAEDQLALARAVELLERPSFAARVADMAGEPIGQLLKVLPRAANDKIRDVVTATMLQGLKVALSSLDTRPQQPSSSPSTWAPNIVAALTGGAGGFFGLLALPLELPVTTTLMLRTIADIARSEGEDLRRARSKLACLEVFALGSRSPELSAEAGYYATRVMLARVVNEAASYIVERGIADQTAPVIVRLINMISSQFGVAVTEKAAIEAVPVVGALGGATINVIFMDHFQKVARGHFIIRRLERKYGAHSIRLLYSGSARRLAASQGTVRLLKA
jgi:hypothetical protein